MRRPLISLGVDSVPACAAAWMRERAQLAPERERALRIASPRRRAQFQAGRWLLAQLLARREGAAATDWLVSTDATGAPNVIAPGGKAAPWVSIAHRHGLIAVAIADRPVGLDVEPRWPPRDDDDDRADMILAEDERRERQSAGPSDRAELLCARWTLKEAWSKRERRVMHLGDFRALQARPAAAGGNARLWIGPDWVAALCGDVHDLEAEPEWPGPGMIASSWYVGPVETVRPW